VELSAATAPAGFERITREDILYFLRAAEPDPVTTLGLNPAFLKQLPVATAQEMLKLMYRYLVSVLHPDKRSSHPQHPSKFDSTNKEFDNVNKRWKGLEVLLDQRFKEVEEAWSRVSDLDDLKKVLASFKVVAPRIAQEGVNRAIVVQDALGKLVNEYESSWALHLRGDLRSVARHQSCCVELVPINELLSIPGDDVTLISQLPGLKAKQINFKQQQIVHPSGAKEHALVAESGEQVAATIVVPRIFAQPDLLATVFRQAGLQRKGNSLALNAGSSAASSPGVGAAEIMAYTTENIGSTLLKGVQFPIDPRLIPSSDSQLRILVTKSPLAIGDEQHLFNIRGVIRAINVMGEER
jgi:hypothetical protein